MKIYFNRRPVQGPWGGGSKVLFAIIDECLARNHEVFFEEAIRSSENFDILFCIDPRPSQLVDYKEILFKKSQHQKSRLIQRIGDLGTHGKPELFSLLKSVIHFPDAIIFPSEWAKNYLNPPQDKRCHIIQNAPLQQFIVPRTKKIFPEKLSIVSHHWSDNSLKGFDVYKKLDEYCISTGKASFTFVGRKPDSVSLTNYIPPQDVDGLIVNLPQHHVYVTASKQEAGANHVLEAIALGLPVLYHKDGGSINEYCEKYGIVYNDFEDLIRTLEDKKDELQFIVNNTTYLRSAKDMAKEYVNLFESTI